MTLRNFLYIIFLAIFTFVLIPWHNVVMANNISKYSMQKKALIEEFAPYISDTLTKNNDTLVKSIFPDTLTRYNPDSTLINELDSINLMDSLITKDSLAMQDSLLLLQPMEGNIDMPVFSEAKDSLIEDIG